MIISDYDDMLSLILRLTRHKIPACCLTSLQLEIFVTIKLTKIHLILILYVKNTCQTSGRSLTQSTLNKAEKCDVIMQRPGHKVRDSCIYI